MQTMVREAWTDERLDQGFREVRAELGELRAEIGRVREGLGEVRAEIKGLEKKFDARFDGVVAQFEAMNRTMQIGFSVIGVALAVIGAILVGLIGLVATQL